MLSKDDALAKVQSAFPDRRIEFFLDYQNLYLVEVFNDADIEEGEYDPFYSISKDTGEIQEFSVIRPGLRVHLTALWAKEHGLVLP